MSTKGIFGLYKDNVSKLTYMPQDAYPDWLGENLVNFIQNTTIENLNAIFDKIIMKETNKTHEKIKKSADVIVTGDSLLVNLNNFVDKKITEANNKRDFNLLFNQEKIELIDDSNFIKNSLYCEWGYIINLSENIFEIYKGGQKRPTINRYYNLQKPLTVANKRFYNCKLIDYFDLNNIPKNWKEIISKEVI